MKQEGHGAHLRVHGHNDGGVSSKSAAARLRVLLQQAVDQPQQLHHALLSRSCGTAHDNFTKTLLDLFLIIGTCLEFVNKEY